MGKGNFRHPTKSTPLNQSPKKFVTGNYVGDQYSYAKLSARMSTGGFWANGLNITKIILIYAPVLEELTYRSDPSTDFHAWWLKRSGLAPGCAFLGHVNMALHLKGRKYPENNYEASIGVFKPNSQNRKTCILSKLLHRFQPNFARC